MGIEVAGYNNAPDWPKLGPSLIIATSLVLAIRTAKWPPEDTHHLSSPKMDAEIAFSADMAKRVMAYLVSRDENIFPSRKEPWYQATEEGVPK